MRAKTISIGFTITSTKDPSAGASIVQEPLRDRRVGVDPAVAKERPVRPHDVDPTEVALDEQRLLAIRRGAGEDAAERVGDEGVPPEGQAALPTDAIHGCD